MSDLNPKQLRFVQEYLIDLNGKQAAIRAGYSPNSAEVQASQLLRNPKVSAEVAKRQTKIAAKFELKAEDVAAELHKIGFANMQDYVRVTSEGEPFVDLSTMSREQAAAIAEVTVEDFKDGRGEDARDVRRVKFKLADKRAALVDLGRHLGMFTDKLEVSGSIGLADRVSRSRARTNG